MSREVENFVFEDLKESITKSNGNVKCLCFSLETAPSSTRNSIPLLNYDSSNFFSVFIHEILLKVVKICYLRNERCKRRIEKCKRESTEEIKKKSTNWSGVERAKNVKKQTSNEM